MNAAADDDVLSAVTGLRENLGRPEAVDAASLSRGRLARSLAASKPGGLLLCVDAPELSFWLRDGMNITSKLICLSSDHGAVGTLARSHQDDIRLSFHSQHAIAFLGDVEDHRFDLMVCTDMDPAFGELAVNRLADGGILALFASKLPDVDTLFGSNGRVFMSTCANDVLIAVKTPADRTAGRRGGRKRRRPPDL